MMMHKTTPYVGRLQLVIDTFGHSINEPTSQNSIKVSKVVKPTNKTLGTSVIKSSMSHSE